MQKSKGCLERYYLEKGLCKTIETKINQTHQEDIIVSMNGESPKAFSNYQIICIWDQF